MRPEVPWSVSAPFAAAIGAKATETMLLLGFPVGCALAAVRLTHSQGLVRLTLFPTLFALALFAIGANWNVDADQPGRVAIGLLERTRKSCEGATEPRGAVVPMVGMSWLCFPGQQARVVGELPGSGGKVWFSARSLEAEPDLSGFTLSDFRLAGNAAPHLTAARLHVTHAQVTGLPPWGRPAKLPVPVRSALLGFAAWLIAVVSTLAFAWLDRRPGWAALLAAGAPAVLILALLGRLDTSNANPHQYGWLPLVAAVSAITATALFGSVARWVQSRFAGESPR
jgi:hypothetical protein